METKNNIKKASLLIVSKHTGIRNKLKKVLKKSGYLVHTADTGTSALRIVKTKYIDIVLSGINVPGINGIELLKSIKRLNEDIEVVILTGHASVSLAVEAIRAGAYDYILKPISNIRLQVINILEKAIEKHTLRIHNKKLTALIKITHAMSAMTKLDELMDIIMQMALTSTNSDGGSIMLRDFKKDELYIEKAIGIKESIIKTTRVKMGERIAGWAAKHAKPLLLQKNLEDYPEFQKFSTDKKIRSAICAPISVKDTVIGVINLRRKKSPYYFTYEDLQMLVIFADNAAVAIENARLFDKLKKTIKDLEITKTKLKHSEKLILLGELSAGLAHEIRNPLMSINLSIDFLKKHTGGSDLKTDKHLDIMKNEINHTNNLISNLLEFSRIKEVSYGTLDINRVVVESVNMLEQRFKLHNIKKNMRLSKKNLEVNGDSNLLKQVFLNILINAIQSMGNKGTLTVSTKKDIKTKTASVSFSDTGKGITDENKSKIFEPFFTTKEKGTGLGLSISASIIEKHKGKIEITDNKDRGTTFKIVLPC